MTKQKSKKMLVVKLTNAGVDVLHEAKFDLGTDLSVVASGLKKEWKECNKIVKADKTSVAVAFAEVYNPKYDDNASGELTNKLDKVIGLGILLSKTNNKPTTATTATTVTPPTVKKKRTTAGRTKADEVRELIGAHPKKGLEELVELAVTDLNMPRGRARGYMRDNIPRVRGNS